MEYRTLGRTGLRVSVVGIGTGGASRLGLGRGSSESDAIGVVRRGLELGVTYFDTAAHYGTEEVLGRALDGDRDRVVISTKQTVLLEDGTPRSAASLRASVEASLVKLRTERIDVFHLHRVPAQAYRYAAAVLVSELGALRDEGKIGWLAISESSENDVAHEMLAMAQADRCFDVVMVGFNLFNQSARTGVLVEARDHETGVEVMAAARAQFSDRALLVAELRRLVAAGELDPEVLAGDPLAFLRVADRELSVTEVSYRFAAAEPGVHTVLVGTGSRDHLEQNVAAIGRGPLPADCEAWLRSTFGHLRAEVHVAGREREPF